MFCCDASLNSLNTALASDAAPEIVPGGGLNAVEVEVSDVKEAWHFEERETLPPGRGRGTRVDAIVDAIDDAIGTPAGRVVMRPTDNWHPLLLFAKTQTEKNNFS